jgi:hypothetical protein
MAAFKIKTTFQFYKTKSAASDTTDKSKTISGGR